MMTPRTQPGFQRSALLLISAALAAASCGSSDDATHVSSGNSQPQSTSSTGVPTSQAEPLVGTISIDPATAPIGSTIAITMDCPGPVGLAQAELRSSDSPEPVGELIQLSRANPDPAVDSVWEGEITLPYWLPPGTQELVGYCAAELNLDVAPATIEVSHDGAAPWDTWKPIVAPSPGVAVDGAVEEPDGAIEVPVTDGSTLPLVATCSSEIDHGGARFVIWQRLAGGTDERDDGFFFVQYEVPSDGYRTSEAGVEIATEVTIRAEDFPDLGTLEERPVVTALCEETSPAFEADAEPTFEASAIILSADFT